MQQINYFKNIEKIFTEGYGFKGSMNLNLPIDVNGEAIPLYSYPAIEYIKSLDFSEKEIFEFGAGNSTIFWSKIAKNVTSIENNQDWLKNIQEKLKCQNRSNYILEFKKEEEYRNFILKNNKKYDVIIIDCNENRLKCAKNTIKSIKEDGLIILDNSDWFPNSAKLIKDELDFIQIDFYGFRPSKHNTSVTSLFFSRNSQLSPLKKEKQPSYAIGGLKKHSCNDK